MKVATYQAPGNFRIEEVAKQKPKKGWVQLETKVTGICGSDLHAWRSERSGLVGKILGHEISGVISEVGSGVESPSLGDRVAVEPLVGCGECIFCRTGRTNLCDNLQIIGYALPGGFAEYLNVPAEKARSIPEGISFESAALLDCVACGLHAAQTADVTPDDTVVILGAGTIGLCSLVGARLLGAGLIIVSGGYSKQFSISKSLGADEVINYRRDDVVKRVLELTDWKGADAVIECVGGAASTVSQAVSLAKKNGRIVIAGGFSGPLEVDIPSIYRKEIHLTGSFCYSLWHYRSMFDIALQVMASGKFDFEDLVTHRFTLDEINGAFKTAADKSTNSVKVEIIF
jgi:2-desacetyl-2-hydroxyethyl bacteriochlorophyllide A dehydrogenase